MPWCDHHDWTSFAYCDNNILGRSNLGAMHDENENDREQLLRQREEVAMLKEQLEAKVCVCQMYARINHRVWSNPHITPL